MRYCRKLSLALFLATSATLVFPLLGQQKGQWVPGQFGLNAGVIPAPGVTYANLALNYSAGQLNDSNNNPVSAVTGTYSFWVDENIPYYVPKHKFLGGYFMPYIAPSYASGELVADLTGTTSATAEVAPDSPTCSSNRYLWAGILTSELTSTPDTPLWPRPADTQPERVTTWAPDIRGTINVPAPRSTSPRTKRPPPTWPPLGKSTDKKRSRASLRVSSAK